MKKIKELEEALKNRYLGGGDTGVSLVMMRAYEESRLRDTEFLGIDCCISQAEMEQFLDECLRFGIREIAISADSTSMLKLLWEFDKRGYKLVGMAEVPVGYLGYRNRGIDKKKLAKFPAIMLRYQEEPTRDKNGGKQ